ncbi:hypothetical protein JTB14_003810 [Gonioctena quinquepunctata]|nr:hypothetical protein JTB14_003810 [Gonioctena quinquepunctata]
MINGFKACGLSPWNPNSIDFSKCLGKKKTDSNILFHTNDENVMKFRKFKDIIGPTKVNSFTNIGIQFERNEDKILYQLWKEFQHPNTEGIQEMKTNIPENFVENLQTEAGNALNAEKTVGVLSAPIVIENDGIWHEITLNNLYEITMDESMEITKDNTNEIIINNDELDKGTIDQYSHYPNTPQRKGKKTSQKTSFILSSSSWKRFLDDKELKKQAELEEKENRKRERELKKVNREKAALEKNNRG